MMIDLPGPFGKSANISRNVRTRLSRTDTARVGAPVGNFPRPFYEPRVIVLPGSAPLPCYRKYTRALSNTVLGKSTVSMEHGEKKILRRGPLVTRCVLVTRLFEQSGSISLNNPCANTNDVTALSRSGTTGNELTVLQGDRTRAYFRCNTVQKLHRYRNPIILLNGFHRPQFDKLGQLSYNANDSLTLFGLDTTRNESNVL